MERASWDNYFMLLATVAATRGTCCRKQVGAVIVRDRSVLATGYNGSTKGSPHCTDEGVGCMMEHGHCVRTTHAEANAIVQAARNGNAIQGATLYTTASPCFLCFKLIANSGIARVIFGELYRRDDRVWTAARAAGIEIDILGKPEGA